MITRTQGDFEQLMLAPTACHDSSPAGSRSAPTELQALAGADLPPEARAFLDRLLRIQIVTTASADRFLERHADHLAAYTSEEMLGEALVQDAVLTSYQMNRVLAGTTHGLVLGNYRVLDRLGAGAMGVVFLGEHVLLRRQVAIKAMPLDDDCPPALLERFYAEMRVLADLHHPHIVLAYDAGKLPPGGPNAPGLLYLVMEYVSGRTLRHIVDDGPLGCESPNLREDLVHDGRVRGALRGLHHLADEVAEEGGKAHRADGAAQFADPCRGDAVAAGLRHLAHKPLHENRV